MAELKYQKWIVDAVKSDGESFAEKISHRFKGGVADLFIKMVNYPPSWFEVKWNTKPVQSPTVKLDVTPLQLRFLRNNHKAGMDAGIISILTDSKLIGILILPVEQVADETDLIVRVDKHKWEKVIDRTPMIRDALKKHYMGG